MLALGRLRRVGSAVGGSQPAHVYSGRVGSAVAARQLSGGRCCAAAAAAAGGSSQHRRLYARQVGGMSTSSPDMTVFNEEQVKMLEELCILVDEQDAVIGADSKKNVHLIDGPSMRPGGMPHRAFSVFLFNEANELLMQKRSAEKILFPHHWANTCCSHPLHDGATFLDTVIHGEMEGPLGTIRAARRKLEQELGIPPADLPEDCFTFLTKIHYKAPMPGESPQWGEHEIDYILFAKPSSPVSFTPNPEEVSEARYFSQDEIKAFCKDGASHGELISPWFGEIEHLLLCVPSLSAPSRMPCPNESSLPPLAESVFS
jgi:isopentenyl-diphosphate delta-isomerase